MKKQSSSPQPTKTEAMAFGKKNYMIMLAGIGVLLLGFFIMSIDTEPFGFGFLGLTLGPLLVMTGFGIQFWAIFQKDDHRSDSSE